MGNGRIGLRVSILGGSGREGDQGGRGVWERGE